VGNGEARFFDKYTYNHRKNASGQPTAHTTKTHKNCVYTRNDPQKAIEKEKGKAPRGKRREGLELWRCGREEGRLNRGKKLRMRFV